jgi:SNF2 family DNA or RNA helicase
MPLCTKPQAELLALVVDGWDAIYSDAKETNEPLKTYLDGREGPFVAQSVKDRTLRGVATAIACSPEAKKPYPHQTSFAVAFLLRESLLEMLYHLGRDNLARRFRSGGMLLDDMGMGKTYSVMTLIVGTLPKLVEPPDLSPWGAEPRTDEDVIGNGKTLLIVPSILFPQWEDVLSTYGVVKAACVGTVKSGKTKYLKYAPETNVVLVSSELLKSRGSILWAMKTIWSRIIIDEGHIIKDSKTVTATVAAELRGLHRFVVTATPVMNKGSELVALLRWVGFSKDELDTSDKAASVTRRCSLQRTTDDISLVKMTRLVYTLIKVELSQVESSVLNAISESGMSSMAVMQGMRQAQFCPSSAFEIQPWKEVLLDLGLRKPPTRGPVVKALVAHFMSLDPSRRAIVFTHFTYELEIICLAFAEANIMTERLCGEDNATAKCSAMKSFTKGSARVLVANIKCGGIGLNLQAASVVYLTTSDFNPFTEIQGISRAHRTGQERDVDAVFITALNADGADMERRMQKMQFKKLRLVKELVRLNPKGATHVQRLEDGKNDVEEQEASDAVAKAESKAAKDAEKAAAKAAKESAKDAAKDAAKAERHAAKRGGVRTRRKTTGDEADSPAPEGAGSCGMADEDGMTLKAARGNSGKHKNSGAPEKPPKRTKKDGAAAGPAADGRRSKQAMRVGGSFVVFQAPTHPPEKTMIASVPTESNSMLSS